MRKSSKASPNSRRKRAKQGPPVAELPVWKEVVQGGPLVRQLSRYVQHLRQEDDAHGNRQLFLDDVFLVYLLAFFNPTIRSLRMIDDFSQTVQAQRHLSTGRICRTTLSDFNKLVDPERLQPIIAALRSELERRGGLRPPADMSELLQQVLAVDGTFFTAAADVAWAIGSRNQHKQGRVDVHLDVHTWLPEVIAVPEPGMGEAQRAATAIKPDAIHVYDRGFASFELLAAHYKSGAQEELVPQAQFVLRVARGQCLMGDTAQERELTEDDRRYGLRSDRVGRLKGSQGRPAPPIVVREITLPTPGGEELRLLTNLLDVPAPTVAEVYRHRWQIELFFRWLKCYANFSHLASHSRQGVLLNFYVVIIGVLLMYLHSGGRPSKYALALLSVVAQGGGSLESILPILRERERQCALARASAARRRARKQSEAQ